MKNNETKAMQHQGIFFMSGFSSLLFLRAEEKAVLAVGRYVLQVAGCRLKFNYNWKTAGT